MYTYVRDVFKHKVISLEDLSMNKMVVNRFTNLQEKVSFDPCEISRTM